MEKPKYNIGDVVWTIEGNKAIRKQITSVGVIENEIYYYGFNVAKYEHYLNFESPESCLFPTKEELIKSL